MPRNSQYKLSEEKQTGWPCPSARMVHDPSGRAAGENGASASGSALAVLTKLRGAISDFKGHGMPGFTDRAAAYLILAEVDDFIAKAKAQNTAGELPRGERT